MSTLFSALKPVLLTRMLEETPWSASLAGLLVAAPFAGIAVSSLLFFFRPPSASVRRLGILFGLALLVLEVVSAFNVAHAAFLLPMQFLAGFCVGALMATTSRIIAKSDAPDESFGFVDMTAVALMSAMVAGAGYAVTLGGLRGGYLFAAVTASIYVLGIVSYRDSRTRKESGKTVHISHPPIQVTARSLAVLTMGVLFVSFSGLGFAFMFSMARELGLSYEEAGSRLGLLLFASASACLMGGWCSGRFGPRYPLLLAFIGCAVGWSFAVHTQSPSLFIAALVPAIFSLQFAFPILLALAASLDKQGQWAGISAPLITSGFAWAAIIAGLVVDGFGISALPLATAIGMSACALLLWPATSEA